MDSMPFYLKIIKFLSFLLLSCLLWVLLPANISAKEAQTGENDLPEKGSGITVLADGSVSGDCGENGNNVTWRLKNGTLTISGKGKMQDYVRLPFVPWSGRFIKKVVITDGVTSIGNYAFYECHDIVSIEIPVSVTAIASAFVCDSLADIYYGGGAKEWRSISIEEQGRTFYQAKVHYASTQPPAKKSNIKTAERKKVSKLVKALDNFVFYSLERYFLQNPQKRSCTVKMDGQAMMTAAAVSTDYWKNKIVKDRSANGDGYIIYKLSSAKLKKRCKDLFGKTVSVSKLRKKRKQQDTWSLYQKSGTPYLYCVTTENDTDLVRKSLSVKKNGRSYTVTEKMYLGHWGMSDTADPNYAITFQVKKSTVSSFGYVVKGMRVKRI